MSELISGKEALIALANGEVVECKTELSRWSGNTGSYSVEEILAEEESEDDDEPSMKLFFRRKPKTININGVDVDKPKSIFTVDSNALDIRFNTEEERNIFLNALHNRTF